MTATRTEDQPGSQGDGFYSAEEDDCEGMLGQLADGVHAYSVPRMEVKKRRFPESASGSGRPAEENFEEPQQRQGVRGWLARIFKRSRA